MVIIAIIASMAINLSSGVYHLLIILSSVLMSPSTISCTRSGFSEAIFRFPIS